MTARLSCVSDPGTNTTTLRSSYNRRLGLPFDDTPDIVRRRQTELNDTPNTARWHARILVLTPRSFVIGEQT